METAILDYVKALRCASRPGISKKQAVFMMLYCLLFSSKNNDNKKQQQTAQRAGK